ncbi:MAG: V-type ATP synthase subunit I [Candidatus Woesearchaeota archaeon]|nr:V-type ATP synthase subunit I [Candidatus Woesearchaeota archaeon]
MFRSHDMTKATLLGHSADREQIIQKLHKLGLLQLIDLKSSNIDLEAAVPTEEVRELSGLLLRVSHLASILKLAPVKQSFAQKLFGLETTEKNTVKRKEKATVVKESEAFLEKNESTLLALEEQYEAALEKIDEYKEYKSVINTLLYHNIPMDVLGETAHCRFTVGKMPTANLAPLKKELKKELKGHFDLEVQEADKRTSVIVIITLQSDTSKVNFLVKKYGLATYAFRSLPPSENPMEWVDEHIEQAEESREEAIENIEKLHGKLLHKAIFLREEIELIEERFEAVHKMKESKKFFVLQGWVTKTERNILKRNMREVIVLEEEPEAGEEPPVRLTNPGFYKPFEMLTELYALPKYKDLDPTFIVAPLFLIYAGFMLTDFVYGFGLVLLGSTLYFLFKRHAKGVSNMGISIGFIGFFSMIFGVLTGSYLGDAPKYFMGLETSQIAIWKDPLADPLYFLIISLIVGIVHLNIGLILGLTEDIRKKAWKTMMSDRVVWWVLQLAVLAFVLKLSLLGKILLGLTVLMVIVLQGPLGLLGMTGFMGDVISYSRLFALALSTAGIAMTVNLLADMMTGIPYVGFVLAAIIFISGHLFSFAMNALGSFVHSIRLQFVEFFSKFYEGGGDKFEPFKEERVYTEVRS